MLSLDPRAGAVGFAYFEGHELLDSGIRTLTTSPQDAIGRIVKLIEWYSPLVVVLPTAEDVVRRRGERVHLFLDAIVRESTRREVSVVGVSREAVRAHFHGTDLRRRAKDRIHYLIAARYPELRARVRRRRIWQKEPYWSAMLDAAARFSTWFVSYRDKT